jgi:hypothetical protein
MATRTLARHTSLLKRLQLAATLLIAPDPFHSLGPTLQFLTAGAAERLEFSVAARCARWSLHTASSLLSRSPGCCCASSRHPTRVHHNKQQEDSPWLPAKLRRRH